MFQGWGHASELMGIYSLTGGFECGDCGFIFIEDPLYFYLDLRNGQIINALFGMLSSKIDSPIKGWVHKTYCSNCNKHIYNYSIEKLNDKYDMEAAYYLLRLLLPKQADFVKKRLLIYQSIAEKIKSNNLDELEKDLRIRRKYYEDLIPELDHDDFNGIVNENEDFDIDNYVEAYEKELDRLQNTVYTVRIGDESHSFTLDGEKFANEICPNCKNEIPQFDSLNFEDGCPNCGGKNILLRFGANYD